MDKAQPVFAAKQVNIPKEIRRELQDLDPVIDHNWEDSINQIMAQVGPDERRYILTQFIEPRGIRYDDAIQRYFYERTETIQEISSRVTSAELSNVCTGLIKILDVMRIEPRPEKFAELAERAVGLLDDFDSGEHLEIQKQKNTLRSTLIHELGAITQATKLKQPASRRGLTAQSVKEYMLDVYLKHEYLGYRFRTLPIGSLEAYPDPFVSGPVAQEARSRQLDIILSSSNLYLIAPERLAHEDPYSIKRFLTEESIMGGKQVYFNGVMIPLSDKLKDPETQKVIEHLISRTITLQRQLSENIVELVEGIERYHEEKLVPLLTVGKQVKSLAAEYVLNNRLGDFEHGLETNVLKKIQHGIEQLASTNDDYEFLFHSLRQLLISLAGEARDFSSDLDESVRGNADLVELRIMALIVLLDKLKPTVFSPRIAKQSATAAEVRNLLKESVEALRASGVKLRKLNTTLRDELARLAKINTRLKKAINRITPDAKKRPDPEDLRRQIATERYNCYQAVIRLLKDNPGVQINLEFEEISPVDEGIRNYAIAQGWEGITKLPLLLRLEEGGGEMDVDSLRAVLASRI